SQQRLGEPEALNLAARQRADGARFQRLRLDQGERSIDFGRANARRSRESPALAGERAGDEVTGAEPKTVEGSMLLGKIAGGRIAGGGSRAENAQFARMGSQESEHGLKQCGLARAVRAEYADELSPPDSGSDVVQYGPPIARERDAIELDGGRVHRLASARSSASSCGSNPCT